MSTTLHPDNTTPEHDDTASEDGNSAAGEGSQVWADAADDAQSEPELEPGQEDGDHDHADSSATITDGAQLAEREDKRLTFLAWEQGKGLDSTLQNLSLADELAGTGELGPEPSTPTPAHTQHQPEQPSTPVNEQTEGQLEKNSTSDPAPAPASSAPSMHPADRLESARSSPSSLASSIRAVSAAPAAPVSESEGSTATAPAGTKPAGTKGAGIAALMKRFDGSASGAAPSSPTSPFAHRQGASPRAGAPAKASATTQVGSAVGSAAALAEATGSLRSPSTAEPSESALGKVRGNTAAEMEMSGAKGAELPQQATDEQAKAQANALDEAAAFAVLPDTGKERVPPAVGATSLLDPETQIANPFRASESSGSSTAGTEGEWTGTRSDSRAEGEGDPARFSTATSGLRSSQISLSSSSVWRRSGAPSLDANGTRGAGAAASSNRFSVVSLGSTAPSFAQSAHDGDEGPGVRRRTITTTSASGSPQLGTPGNGPAFASSSDEASKNGMGTGPQEMDPRNYDFLLARLETQNARLSRDPKAQRASVDGADKLRENFERLANRERRKSQRGSGVLGGQAQDAQDERNGLAAREGAATQAEDLYADVDADGDEAIDWDFWGNVMSNYQQIARVQPRELSRAIQAGIPAALRGMMWQLMSSSKDEEMEIIYAYYLKETSPHEKAIRRDLSRTFPEQTYFQDGKGVGQENLFNVVKAYSLYDPECGYCQGMQFVVGPLLLNMPDEEAFSTLVRLMKSYDLRGHYIPNMPSLQLRLFQFDRLVEEFLPLLHMHLVRQGVKSSMYASQWFMTLFSYRFPLDLVYRILDSVFAEGIEALFRFAIALMKKSEDRLLGMNFEDAVDFLKTRLFDVYERRENTSKAPERTSTSAPDLPKYRTNEFVRDAFEVKITPYMLDAYASEFDEQVKAANAHRREVDALRLVNRNLAARVKALEEQLNQVNAEHVDLVKSVVMAKLAKEEMAEELVRYKVMYAEAVLQADGAGPSQSPTRLGKS